MNAYTYIIYIFVYILLLMTLACNTQTAGSRLERGRQIPALKPETLLIVE